MHVRIYAITIVTATLIAGPLVAAPQEEEVEVEEDGTLFSLSDFRFRVGFYDISASTKVRVDGKGGRLGLSIDLEDDLELDDEQSTSYLALGLRMSGRHFLELEQFNLNRSGDTTLTAELEFGDEVYEIGATVSSFFDTKVTRISYAYLLRDTEKYLVALSAGLHVTELATGISEIQIGFSEPTSVIADVTAPLPVFGISAAWKFSDKWITYGRAQIFRLSISDYTGRLDHASAKLEYAAFQHVGVGIGYDLFDLDLEVDRRFWTGNVEFRFHGPMLYLIGSF